MVMHSTRTVHLERPLSHPRPSPPRGSLNLSLPIHGRPLSRVATRCCWKPVCLFRRQIPSRRYYHEHVTEGFRETPQQIAFVERFPLRNPPNSTFYPYPRRLHEQDRWGVQEVAPKPKFNTYNTPVSVDSPLRPVPKGEEIAEELFSAASGLATDVLTLEHDEATHAEEQSPVNETAGNAESPEDAVEGTRLHPDVSSATLEQSQADGHHRSEVIKETPPSPTQVDEVAVHVTASSVEPTFDENSAETISESRLSQVEEDRAWSEKMAAMGLSIWSTKRASGADRNRGKAKAEMAVTVETSPEVSVENCQPSEWVPLDEREKRLDLQQELVISPSVDLELEAETETQPRTIHVLGTGSVGKYIAHALAGLPSAPPVTLMMHTGLLMQQWHDEGGRLNLFKDGAIESRENFLVESAADARREFPEQRFPGFGKDLEHTLEQPETVIESLIVTTEGHATISALSAIQHRLRPSSTVCFIQDGLGVMELVNYEIFRDPDNRPSYMLGSLTHDLRPTDRKFTFIEKETGKLVINIAPRNLLEATSRRRSQQNLPEYIKVDYGWSPSSQWLTRTLLRSPELSAVGLQETDFYDNQLQKLAVNSIIGPLSVMYDCYNEDLLYNFAVSQSMNLLIEEVSAILLQLPETARSDKSRHRFTSRKLEKVVIGVLGKTGRNTTQMLQDVRKGKQTDIDFYSGYLLSRAKSLRFECPHLEMMVAMVKGKQELKCREHKAVIPFKV